MYASKKIVVVVGMHRSGTSLTAGTLHQSGIAMGSDKTFYPRANKENPRGFFEDIRFRRINDRLLEANGYEVKSWSLDFPEYLTVPKRIKLAMYLRCVQYSVVLNSWGFKDPRTCLTLDLWLEVLRTLKLIDRVRIIYVVRSPEEVIESLIRRNSLTFESAEQLVEIYTSRALQSIARWNLPTYSLQMDAVRSAPRKELEKLCSFLEIGLFDGFDTFYDSSLMKEKVGKSDT